MTTQGSPKRVEIGVKAAGLMNKSGDRAFWTSLNQRADERDTEQPGILNTRKHMTALEGGQLRKQKTKNQSSKRYTSQVNEGMATSTGRVTCPGERK